jgi:hypothetical protein
MPIVECNIVIICELDHIRGAAYVPWSARVGLPELVVASAEYIVFAALFPGV